MFCYKVKYDDGGHYELQSGIIAEATSSKAVQILEEYYGEDSIERMELALIDDELFSDKILVFSDRFECNFETFVPRPMYQAFDFNRKE